MIHLFNLKLTIMKFKAFLQRLMLSAVIIALGVPGRMRHTPVGPEAVLWRGVEAPCGSP